MADAVIGTGAVWPAYHQNNEVGANTGQTKTLGKEEFMTLLVTQLQYQDPLSPMENTEYIAQLAQFSSVEQLMGLSTAFRKFANSIGFASTLIGKSVTWEKYSADGTGYELANGIVESVAVVNDEVYAVVDGERVAVADIVEVGNAPDEDDAGDGDDGP